MRAIYHRFNEHHASIRSRRPILSLEYGGPPLLPIPNRQQRQGAMRGGCFRWLQLDSR